MTVFTGIVLFVVEQVKHGKQTMCALLLCQQNKRQSHVASWAWMHPLKHLNFPCFLFPKKPGIFGGPTFSQRRVVATPLLPLPTLRTPGETQCVLVLRFMVGRFCCFTSSWCPEFFDGWWLMVDGWIFLPDIFCRLEDWKMRDLCDFCWQHFVHIPEKKVGDLEIWIQQLFCFAQNSEVWFCHDRNYNAAWAEFVGEGSGFNCWDLKSFPWIRR